MMKRSTMIIIGVLIVIIASAILTLYLKKLAFFSTENNPAVQLYKNTIMLNDFSNICFNKKIVEVCKTKLVFSEYKDYNYEIISSYYVYSSNKIDTDSIKKLSIMLDTFKKYSVQTILISEESYEIQFSIGSFYRIILAFTGEYQPDEKLVRNHGYKDIHYLGDHWYIANID